MDMCPGVALKGPGEATPWNKSYLLVDGNHRSCHMYVYIKHFPLGQGHSSMTAPGNKKKCRIWKGTPNKIQFSPKSFLRHLKSALPQLIWRVPNLMVGWSSTSAIMIWRVPTVWESNVAVDLCMMPSYFLWLSVDLKGCTKHRTQVQFGPKVFLRHLKSGRCFQGGSEEWPTSRVDLKSGRRSPRWIWRVVNVKVLSAFC